MSISSEHSEASISGTNSEILSKTDGDVESQSLEEFHDLPIPQQSEAGNPSAQQNHVHKWWQRRGANRRVDHEFAQMEERLYAMGRKLRDRSSSALRHLKDTHSFRVTKGGVERLNAVDQFRGWTIFLMFLVNFYADPNGTEHWWWPIQHKRHHFRLATLVLPHFMWLSGYATAMSMERAMQSGQSTSAREAYRAVVFRSLRMLLLGLALYSKAPLYWTTWWDALVDLALAGLAVAWLNFYAVWVRICVALLGMLVYTVVLTQTNYATFIDQYSLWDGGPAGTLMWISIYMLGSCTFHIHSMPLWARLPLKKRLGWNALVGIVWCASGCAFAVPWGGMKTEWAFSRQWCTVPFILLTGGISQLSYTFFQLLCDGLRVVIPLFSWLSENSMALYAFHLVFVRNGLEPLDAPDWQILSVGTLYTAFMCLVSYHLHQNSILIKV
eukprot:ANDGO_00510.mRNA.1 hypothetical protein